MSSHTAGPLARGACCAGAGCWANAEPPAVSTALAMPAPRNARRVTSWRTTTLLGVMAPTPPFPRDPPGEGHDARFERLLLDQFIRPRQHRRRDRQAETMAVLRLTTDR